MLEKIPLSSMLVWSALCYVYLYMFFRALAPCPYKLAHLIKRSHIR